MIGSFVLSFYEIDLFFNFLQKNVVSLDGPVVTATGFGDELAVVSHSSPTLPSNERCVFCGLVT